MNSQSEEYVMAFAIEDRFQFRLAHKNSTGDYWEVSPPPKSRNWYAEAERPKNAVDGLKQFFQQALEPHKGTVRIENVSAIAVSCIGVVQNKKLIQIPRECWDSLVDPIDFAELIANNLGWEKNAVSEKLKVYNDATAAAAAAFWSLNKSQKEQVGSSDVVYLKVHNGVNAGVVTGSVEGSLGFYRPRHAEIGHIFPVMHELDMASKFGGTCTYHHTCLEGLLSIRSFEERSTQRISLWPSAQNFDLLLANPLVQAVAAHYLAQVIHQIMLSPYSPAKVIIAGKLATSEIIEQARQFLSKVLLKNYPNFEQLAARDFVVRQRGLDGSDKIRDIELVGALILARNALALKRGVPSIEQRTGAILRTSSSSTIKVGAISIGRKESRWATALVSLDQRSTLSRVEGTEADSKVSVTKEHSNLDSVLRKIAQEMRDEGCSRIGISCWGPFRNLDLVNRDEEYAKITLRQEDLYSYNVKVDSVLLDALGHGKAAPEIYVITDANALALGSLFRRAQKGEFPFSERDGSDRAAKYNNTVLAGLLLGRGIGGGIVVGDKPLQRRYHPEVGHLIASRLEGDTREWKGCKGHGDCFTSILGHENFETNNGVPLLTFEDLKLYARYAAQLAANLTYAVGPESIVLSGSTIKAYSKLVELIRAELSQIFANRKTDRGTHIYQEEEDLEKFVALADEDAALWGALVFAAGPGQKAPVNPLNPR
jgi:predicted NBD/HSP70 family sugar kinase